MARDISSLMAIMSEEYARHAPTSATWNRRAIKVQVDGGSHALRLIKPFPPRIVSATGAWVTDEDGNEILDFWQGHFGNILGHNPAVVTTAIADMLSEGAGLQSGFTDRYQVQLAEILCDRTGYDQVRFTTSGTLATTYAIMLARAHTGRTLVMKAGGGWHGANLWGLKGTKWRDGFESVESAGITPATTDEVVITGYNNPEVLKDHFRLFGDSLACLILEPVIGSGGLLPARTEYLQTARELSNQYGTVLIFDEVITGFRYRAGDVASMYGVKGDLAVFGKIIGGGMPVAAVAGRKEIMELAGRSKGRTVKFSGGTYSGHPASMLASITMINHLIKDEERIYDHMGEIADSLRRVVIDTLASEGVHARFAGDTIKDLPHNSLHMLVFPLKPNLTLDTPEEACNPQLCDLELSDIVLPLAMLLENVFVIHGLGSTSHAHSHTDIQYLGEAVRRVARRIKTVYQGI